MANIQYTATANVSIAGLSPAAGPKPSISVGSPFNSGAVSADDYFSETYVVNAGTTATAINLGKISAGLFVAIQCTGTIALTVTQTQSGISVNNLIQVDSFIMLQSGFTALQIANAGGTAVDVSITVCGNRPAVGNGAGIF